MKLIQKNHNDFIIILTELIKRGYGPCWSKFLDYNVKEYRRKSDNTIYQISLTKNDWIINLNYKSNTQ